MANAQALGTAKTHLRPDERIVWSGRPAVRGLYPTLGLTLAGGGVLAVGFLVMGFVHLVTGIVVAIVGAALAIGGAGQAIQGGLDLIATTYVLTDQRVLSVRSLVSTTTSSIPLERVSKLQLRQDVLSHAMGLWNAHVSAYGQAGTQLRFLWLKDGPEALGHIQDKMQETTRLAWLIRGD